MTDVAVTGFASAVVHQPDGRNDAELLAPVVEQALADSGLGPQDVDVVGTAGSEFLTGVVGVVMGAFDAFPGWPPRTHTHLEGDGAFALFEAWFRLLAGEGRAALVCAFSRPRAADPRQVLRLQEDPYHVAPLGVDPVSVAALQARAMLDSGRWSEDDLAAVVAARRPGTSHAGHLEEPYVASPLRAGDCSTVCSGAAAVVLATAPLARAATRAPAWIRGIAQLMERQSIGARPAIESVSTASLSSKLGVAGTGVDVMELHAPFSHQELILLDAVSASGPVAVNPSGGALPADPIMATGLLRVGWAADAIMAGRAGRAVAHATSGSWLQHNLLCVMEAGR